jgi:hypothetical protein
MWSRALRVAAIMVWIGLSQGRHSRATLDAFTNAAATRSPSESGTASSHAISSWLRPLLQMRRNSIRALLSPELRSYTRRFTSVRPIAGCSLGGQKVWPPRSEQACPAPTIRCHSLLRRRRSCMAGSFLVVFARLQNRAAMGLSTLP